MAALADRRIEALAPGAPRASVYGGFYRRAAVAGLAGAVLGLLACLVWGAIAAFRDNALLWLPYPYPREGSEGLILYQTVLMRAGEAIYGPITPDSFISAPYPPVFYWLASRVMPAGQVGLVDGRGISLWAAIVAALAAGVLVVALVARQGDGLSWRGLVAGLAGGFVAGGVFLAQPAVLTWAARYRPDMLMIGFTACGLLLIALGVAFPARHGEKLVPNWPIWLAVPAFVLAVYTKQTALAGPAAAALFLLLRDRRTGLLWTLATLLAGLVPFAALDFATGHWFYLKMVDYHNLPFDIRTLDRLWSGFWEDNAALLLLGIGYFGWRLWQRRLDLPALFLLANVLLLPTGGVIGADTNHFLPISLALAICAGAAVAETTVRLGGLFKAGSRIEWRPLLALLATGALLVAFFAMAAVPADRFSLERMPSAGEQEQLRLIVANVAATPGDLFFADDAGILALAGKRTAYDDLFTITALAKAGRWDQSALAQRLSSGGFALVLLHGNAFAAPNEPRPLRSDIITQEMLAGLCTGYDVLFRDVIFTYAPRQGGAGRLSNGQCLN